MTRASVEVDGKIVGQIRTGLLVLLGVAKGDTETDVGYLCEKIPALRIFNDETGKMNRSLAEIGGGLLAISQFTLLGDTRKEFAGPPRTAPGSPNGLNAKPFGEGDVPLRAVIDALRRTGYEQRHGYLTIETGVFGAHMMVELLNDGPVTFVLDTRGVT